MVAAPSSVRLRNTTASDHLNLIRGLASLAVVVYHIRYRFFLDYNDISSPDWLTKLFYGFTSFGHDAVIIFFVLSGFFISSSITASIREEKWSWSNYLSSRLTRLYLVLIPGLLLTLFWDTLGLSLFGDHPIYTGQPQVWKHDYFPVAERLTLETFVGNAFFLHTIYVHSYGSNDPLWSLAYEFWYYLLFPVAAIAFSRHYRTPRITLTCLAAIVIVVLLISQSMLIYFPIWLLGWLAGQVPPVGAIRRSARLVGAVATVAFAALLCASHLGSVRLMLGSSVVAFDYLTGCAFAILLWVLLHDIKPSRGVAYSWTSRFLSDMSFSLYVTHMPLLVFLRAASDTNYPWGVSITTIGVSIVLTCALLVYGWLVSRATEANTAKVRDCILAWLPVDELAKRHAVKG
jgi:peptidoglycan/LPS O-acetylase OafA/YrhL